MHFENATDIKYNNTKCMEIWLGPKKATQENLQGLNGTQIQ